MAGSSGDCEVYGVRACGEVGLLNGFSQGALAGVARPVSGVCGAVYCEGGRGVDWTAISQKH